ncbi:MAG: efflux RND transporter permease subunit [Bacteroidota bacterium]|nr:efflux RND transporter permease subunit [Bacteroidota bacterium]
MRKIVQTFVKYPFYANIIIAILLIGGVAAFLNMKKSFFPETASRNITVSVAYPGASPKEMDEGITTRIEQAVRGLVGIKEINSTSSENFCTVRIETTGEYDIDETLAEVKNAVDGISSFPTAAERPIVSKQRSMSMAMYMSLYGNTSLETLKDYAYEIEDDFLASGKISQIGIQGFPPLELSIEVSEENLLRHNLTFEDLRQAVASNNIDLSAGQIKSPDKEFIIRSRNRTVDPNELKEIIIRGQADGSFIRLRDIAVVKQKFADVSNSIQLDGKQAVQLMISKLPEEDLEEISVYTNSYAEQFNAEHEDVKIHVNFDFLTLLKSRLNLLYTNGGMGLFLVLVTLALFLNLRLSGWVAWGIPSAFLAMFILGVMYGITINMISLFGMILVIGILVDDGIVIGENIFSHFETGKSPMKAAVDGTMEVIPAVTTSILTTVIAFSPLLLIKQGGMEFMFEMAFVVIFSLLFSLVEAFFVLPAHLGSPKVLRRNGKKTNIIRKKLNQWIFFMRVRIYGKFLQIIIKWRWIFVSVPIFIVLFTVGLFNGEVIKSTFFPAMSFDNFMVDFAFKPGEGEKQTKAYLTEFDSIVSSVNQELMKEHQDTTDFVKFRFKILGSAFEGVETGSHAGSIMVGLRNLEGTDITPYDIRNRVKEKIGKRPELARLRIDARGNRFGAPISLSLLSNNTEELLQAKTYLQNRMRSIENIQNISDDNAPGKNELKLKLKPKAYLLGLDYNYISHQVRAGFYGTQAQRIQHGKDELRVWVRYPKDNRMTIGQLERMKIKTPAGNFPLSELADYEMKRGPINIKRYNSRRQITVSAGIVSPDIPVPPILDEIKLKILPDLYKKFPGITVEQQGQAKRSKETSQEIALYFSVAIIIILLILMIHFRSVWQALIILSMIPLAWVGALWGHGIEGKIVSMLSAWGMVALSGVIINDAVVFLSKYNRLLVEGKKVKEAVTQAAISRFRPIVLTTITTSVGLYPLILEQSFQAQFLIPMAISLAYGVFVGTGFILILFPAIILVLNDSKLVLRRFFKGDNPTREEVEVAVIHSKRKIK